MKNLKNLILPLIVVLVFGISIYTVSSYNKNKSKNFAITNEQNPKVSTSTPTSNTPSEKDASKVPSLDFKLKNINGKEVSLSDYKGKKVFLNFWASWCGPCKSEMPDIEKLYEQTKNSDLVILTINLGEDKDTVKSFIDNAKYNFTVLLDLDQSVAAQYKISAIPTSYFIDEAGNIVSTIRGSLTLLQMKDYINKL